MMIQGHNYPDIYKPIVDRLDISREREREREVCGMDTFASFARLCLQRV